MSNEEIFKNYHDRVEHYIYGKVCDRYTAEDLTSVVFLKVYEKLSTFNNSKASISTWIFTIANNTVIDYYRTHKITEEIPEEIPEDSNLDDTILQEEMLDELANALSQLPERERDLLVMRFYHNMTLKDIALKMGMSYANAKIVQQKALFKMRSLISIDD